MNRKSQSATEFLMTYGWLFIVLFIMIGVLFYLGFFNINFGARAFTGACYVARPYGAQSTQLVSLAGLCNNLPPKYVMVFGFQNDFEPWTFTCHLTGSCADFISYFSNTIPTCNVTISAWAYDKSMPANGPVPTLNTWFAGSGAEPSGPALGGVLGLFDKSPAASAVDIEYNNTLIRFEARPLAYRNQYLLTGNFQNHWENVVLVLNNGIATGYINGTAVTSPSPQIICPILGNGTIGAWDRGFYGYISNVQIYSSGLSSNDVLALYQEGIGGAPINLQSIVEWFPLNGDVKNYVADNSKNGIDQIIYFSQTYAVPP